MTEMNINTNVCFHWPLQGKIMSINKVERKKKRSWGLVLFFCWINLKKKLKFDLINH